MSDHKKNNCINYGSSFKQIQKFMQKHNIKGGIDKKTWKKLTDEDKKMFIEDLMTVIGL